METKVKFITPFLVVSLILCFLLACTNEVSSSSTTKKLEDLAQELIEAEVVENVAFEEIIEEELIEEEAAEENPVEVDAIVYEEIAIKGVAVLIYTTATDSSKLQQIVDVYKNDKFKSKKIFSLYFYTDREQALDAITNIGLFLPVASYNYNANNGLDELKLLINNIKYNE